MMTLRRRLIGVGALSLICVFFGASLVWPSADPPPPPPCDPYNETESREIPTDLGIVQSRRNGCLPSRKMRIQEQERELQIVPDCPDADPPTTGYTTVVQDWHNVGNARIEYVEAGTSVSISGVDACLDPRQPYTVTVTTDPPGKESQVHITVTYGGTTVEGNGTVTFQPTAGSSGTVRADFTCGDGNSSSTTSFEVADWVVSWEFSLDPEPGSITNCDLPVDISVKATAKEELRCPGGAVFDQNEVEADPQTFTLEDEEPDEDATEMTFPSQDFTFQVDLPVSGTQTEDYSTGEITVEVPWELAPQTDGEGPSQAWVVDPPPGSEREFGTYCYHSTPSISKSISGTVHERQKCGPGKHEASFTSTWNYQNATIPQNNVVTQSHDVTATLPVLGNVSHTISFKVQFFGGPLQLTSGDVPNLPSNHLLIPNVKPSIGVASLNSQPAGTTITWEGSGPITVSGGGTSATVTADQASGSQDDGYVKATYENGGDQCEESFRVTVLTPSGLSQSTNSSGVTGNPPHSGTASLNVTYQILDQFGSAIPAPMDFSEDVTVTYSSVNIGSLDTGGGTTPSNGQLNDNINVVYSGGDPTVELLAEAHQTIYVEGVAIQEATLRFYRSTAPTVTVQ